MRNTPPVPTFALQALPTALRQAAEKSISSSDQNDFPNSICNVVGKCVMQQGGSSRRRADILNERLCTSIMRPWSF
eukprot:6206119-Pleurochrysis_carterae.AAC.2